MFSTATGPLSSLPSAHWRMSKWCAPQSASMPFPVRELKRHTIGSWMPGIKALSSQWRAGPCQRSHMPGSK